MISICCITAIAAEAATSAWVWTGENKMPVLGKQTDYLLKAVLSISNYAILFTFILTIASNKQYMKKLTVFKGTVSQDDG
jgi:hypothetical protein